jgi:hypothetical protein
MSEAAVIILVCALMCPLMMALMMLFMRKGHGESRPEAERHAKAPRDERAD